MSTNWFKDMQDMHKKYGVNKWMQAEQQSDVPVKHGMKYIKLICQKKLVLKKVDLIHLDYQI
jgi:hypothetical protein